jgi:cysteinyl-tRNA synthetase
MVLGRPWAQPWDYAPGLLDDAAARLERLYAAAARPDRGASGHGESGRDAVLDALLDDLDVPRALDVAEEEGGAAARLLLRVLSLG